MTRPALLTIVSALALSACSGGGPSVSGSADEGARSQSGLSSLWERARSLGVDQSKTTDMPALALIADAFLANAATAELKPAALRLMVVRDGDGGRVSQISDRVAHLREQFETLWPSLTPERQAVIVSPAHVAYAVPILAALAPRTGWEVTPVGDRVDPAFDTPFFRSQRAPSSYDPELHLRYMQGIAISAVFTNAVFEDIAHQLEGVRLADPDAAHARVLAAFRSIPPEKLKAMLDAASGQVTSGRFTTDLAGSGNVHFINSDAGDFVSDRRGVTWTRAGGVWFGDGHINGRSVNFKLASTATLAQRQAQTGTSGTDVDASVRGTGSVGPAR